MPNKQGYANIKMRNFFKFKDNNKKRILLKSLILSTIFSELLAVMFILLGSLQDGTKIISSGGSIIVYLLIGLLVGIIFPNIVLFVLLFILFLAISKIPKISFSVFNFVTKNKEKIGVRKQPILVEKGSRLDKILCWIFGIIFLVLGIELIIRGSVSALFFLLLGLFLFPPIRLEKHFSGKIKLVIAITTILFIAIILPSIEYSTQPYNSISSNIQSNPNQQIINSLSKVGISQDRITNLTRYTNGSEVTGVIIEILYQKETFVDEYLKVAYDSADIYKSIFSENPDILAVGISFIKQDYDTYGNLQYSYLAYTVMGRDIYNKINWANFQRSDITKITTFEYLGDNSFYKSLSDLRNSLEKYKGSVTTQISSGNSGVTSDVCAELQKQCSTSNECEEIQMAKQAGVC